MRRVLALIAATPLAATVPALAGCSAGGAGPHPPADSRDEAVSSPEPDPVGTPRLRAVPPAPTTPLVIAMHRTRVPLDVSRDQAQALLDGAADGTVWGSDGAPRLVAAPGVAVPPGGEAAATLQDALEAVRTDRGTLALVPGPLMGPTVQPVTVDGVHPLRDPTATR